jgi:hypothetical protein
VPTHTSAFQGIENADNAPVSFDAGPFVGDPDIYSTARSALRRLRPVQRATAHPGALVHEPVGRRPVHQRSRPHQ